MPTDGNGRMCWGPLYPLAPCGGVSRCVHTCSLHAHEDAAFAAAGRPENLRSGSSRCASTPSLLGWSTIREESQVAFFFHLDILGCVEEEKMKFLDRTVVRYLTGNVNCAAQTGGKRHQNPILGRRQAARLDDDINKFIWS